MATAAEPRPAELPLPGGLPGASVRVHPLLTGERLAPPAWLVRERGGLARAHAFGLGVPRERWTRVPVPAFCVEHPGAGALLIDTGFHAAVALRPRENLGRIAALALKQIEMRPEQAVPAQLRARGIDPHAVAVVVMTHLHVDHASGIAEFPQATFVVSGEEWREATRAGARQGYNRRQFDHAFDYRLVDFDSPETGSFSGFGRSLDLFGDGSVRLVSTPGHTAGHTSVVLRLRERELLVAGDAIYLERSLTEGLLPWRMQDEHRYRRSLRELELYARETPNALVIPGHDIDAWRRLGPVLD